MGQQTARPPIAAACDAGQPADLGCGCRGLRVDQARRHLVPIGKRAALCLSEASCHEVGQPAVQLGHADRDPLGSLGRPKRSSLRVDDGPLAWSSSVGYWCCVVAGRSRIFRLAGRPWETGLRCPRSQPRRSLGRGRGLDHFTSSSRPQKEQGQGVLAWELPARAAAAIGRPGGVDDYAIGSLGAPPAGAPHRSVIVAELRPWGRAGELVCRPKRTVVTGQAFYFFRGRSPHENESSGRRGPSRPPPPISVS